MSNSKRNRLRDENTALLRILNRHLSNDELALVNEQLHDMALLFIHAHAHKNLCQAYYDTLLRFQHLGSNMYV